jgi:hypothetical protein
MAPIARLARITTLALVAFVALGTAEAAPDWESRQPALDPFRTLIEKPKRPDPRPVDPVPVPLTPRPAPIRPISLEVLALVRGERASSQMALIEYRGQEYLIRKDWDGSGESSFDQRFRVKELTGDELVLYDRQAKRLQRVDLADRAGKGLELSAAR